MSDHIQNVFSNIKRYITFIHHDKTVAQQYHYFVHFIDNSAVPTVWNIYFDYSDIFILSLK